MRESVPSHQVSEKPISRRDFFRETAAAALAMSTVLGCADSRDAYLKKEKKFALLVSLLDEGVTMDVDDNVFIGYQPEEVHGKVFKNNEYVAMVHLQSEGGFFIFEDTNGDGYKSPHEDKAAIFQTAEEAAVYLNNLKTASEILAEKRAATSK